MTACFSMLLSVPIGISRTGCGTVTRPGFTGCLNCLWLPTCATSYQPSCFKPCMTSRLDIRYTLSTHLSSRGLQTVRSKDTQVYLALPRFSGALRRVLATSVFDATLIVEGELGLLSRGFSAHISAQRLVRLLKSESVME